METFGKIRNLAKKIEFEHANNLRKTGKYHLELRVIREAIVTQTKYLTPSAKAVLNVLKDEAERFNPTREVIARKAAISVSSVRLAINQLESYALIKREPYRRKLGRGQTEKAVKYHLNHISAWRLPDGASIARTKYPTVNFDRMIAYEHGKLGLQHGLDFGVIVNLGQKIGKGRKPKQDKEHREQVDMASGYNCAGNTEKPKAINENPNPEKKESDKINLKPLTDLMRKVLGHVGVFPGIKETPASYRDCLDELRNKILAGLRTENPRLDLEAMLYSVVDQDELYRAMARNQRTQWKMRRPDFWIEKINAGNHLRIREQLAKSA